MSDSFSISEAIVDNNGDLATLSAPSINDSGTIALFGTLDDGDRGIFTFDDELTPVVRDSELDGEFASLGENISLNNNGSLVYTVENFVPPEGFGAVDLILNQNGLITTLDTLEIFNSQENRKYNNFTVNDNEVVFANSAQLTFIGLFRPLELFFPDGTSEIIATAGGPPRAPAEFSRIGLGDVNNQNTVAYIASIPAENGTSVYTTDGRVIPLSTANLGGGPADEQKDIVINDSGEIFVNFEQPSGKEELFQISANDELTSLTSTDGLFDNFDDIALNNEGQIAFGAVLDDGTEGIFTGIEPESDRLIAVGDPLSGSTVVDLEFDTEGLNNSGIISFQAELADGTVGIYQADLTHVEVEVNQINGTDRADILRGTAAADLIDGGNGRDLLIALAGSDTLMGGNGRDVLVGVAPNSKTPGVGEIDVLVGGQGNDTFDLGGINQVYYDDGDATTAGEADYALISDLENGDVIVLRGSADDYLLENNFSIDGETGTAILRQDSTNEIISLVKDASNLNLNSNNFVFV